MTHRILLIALFASSVPSSGQVPLDSMPDILLPDLLTWEDAGAGEVMLRSGERVAYRGTFDPVTRKGEGAFFGIHDGEAEVDSTSWTGAWSLGAGGKITFIGQAEIKQFNGGSIREYIYDAKVMAEMTPDGLQPLTGYHEVLYIDGSGYAGEWKQGRKHGQGAIFHCMCLLGSWEGGWKNGLPHGKGAEYHPLWNWRFEGRKREGEWAGSVAWYPESHFDGSNAPFTFHNLQRDFMTVRIKGAHDEDVLDDIREEFEANVDGLRKNHSDAFSEGWEPFISDFRGLLQTMAGSI